MLAFISAFSLIFIAFLTYRVYLFDKRYRLPPGPAPMPWLGNLHLVAASGKKPILWKFFADLAVNYGPIFTFYMGPIRMIVLNNAKLVHEAIVEKGKTFSWRLERRMPGYETMPEGIVFANHEKWRKHRRFTLKTMRDFGMGKDTMVFKIQEEVGNLLECLELCSKQREALNPATVVTNAVSNVVCALVLGKRLHWEDPNFKEIIRITNELAHHSTVESTAFMLLPWLKYLKYPSQIDAMHQARMLLEKLLTVAIDEHRTDFDKDNIRDFPDLFLLSQLDQQGNERLEMDDFAKIMTEMFLAGSETTSTALCWTMFYLTKHPDLQKKCQEAIEKVIDTDRLPTLADRPQLVYIDAVMHEVLRHASITPLNLFHSNLDEKAELAGYDVPPNSLIVYNVTALHFNEDYWYKPQEFNPDRWIGADGQLLSHSSHFMPFGLGPRICLGEGLARVEYFIFLVSMLHRYNFKLTTPNACYEDGFNGLVHKPPFYQMTVESR